MSTIDQSTITIPAPEAAKPKAAKPKAAKPKAAKPNGTSTPNANREGQGGKGNVVGAMSNAQRVAAFRSDTAALAATLQSMGANVRTQASRNGVFVYRVYADLHALRATRDKAEGDDKALARAAIAAFEAVAGFRSGCRWVSATLYANSAYFGVRVKPGDHHPGNHK